MNHCQNCHKPYVSARTTRHKGFKGAAYSMTVYTHTNSECVYQTAYYPDYFGKGPKTKVHKWESKLSTPTPVASKVPTAKLDGTKKIYFCGQCSRCQVYNPAGDYGCIPDKPKHGIEPVTRNQKPSVNCPLPTA